MGTRHLTVVKLDGEWKVAQYGQWDGYPEGQGITVLEFARKLQDHTTAEKFIQNLRKCRWLYRHEVVAINKKIENGEIKDLLREYPQFHRDTGAEILDYVLSQNKEEIVLESQFDFAFDHLFCEYIWGIDLDKSEFGLYVGADKVKDIVPVKTWKIEEAPTDEEFIKAFEENES